MQESIIILAECLEKLSKAEAIDVNDSAMERDRADGLQEQPNTFTNDLADARNSAANFQDPKARLGAAEAKIKAGNKADIDPIGAIFRKAMLGKENNARILRRE